ncbi:Spc7-domain-containing protein [Xylariaceae sp. FL0804]|nr:Spc7-domain-containing protein [Xylariaceae sp. FL0804]
MTNRADVTMPSTRRPRKSTGHSPVRKRIEKENITVDVASSLVGNGGRKKSRSKSMGPGGLDVLKAGSGNRRVSLAAPPKPLPRSILKPTVPPLPEIPPHKSKSARKSPPTAVQGVENLPNPFQNDDSSGSGTKIALRTEEEQQAAAREREERERAQMEKEINDRREARRKSLANRRVSFAAEATLHTFHEVEFMQDSTTSTDSTRRASSMPAAQSPAPPPEASDPPSTPPEKVEDVVPGSPDHQRDLHQKKRRRSSGASTMNLDNHDDLTIASTIYSSDSEGVVETHEEIGTDSDSDSADGVSVDLDIDEVTGTSVASAMSARSAFTDRSGFTDESNDTLDGALRLASRRAENQIDDGEEEVIPSFGWAKKPVPKPASPTEERAAQSKPSPDEDQDDDGGMDMDMDITAPVGGIFQPKDDFEDDAQNEELSMDVTRMLGGILPQRTKPADAPSAFPANVGDVSTYDDSTMDLTTAIGGIRKASQTTNNLIDLDDDEDMSMELTSVIGGVVPANQPNAAKRRQSLGRRRTMTGDDEVTMDMTVGLGRIIEAESNGEDKEEATTEMDMTTAIGGIIKGPSPVKDRTQAKQVMEEETDKPESPVVLNSPAKRRLSDVLGTTRASENGSPGLSAFRGNGLRRSTNLRTSGLRKSQSPTRHSPALTTASPRRQNAPSTPDTPQQSSPLKTPISQKSQRPSTSPRRSVPASSIRTPLSVSKIGPKTSLFQQDISTGVAAPQVVLTPQPRRLSGVGADRSGLGSPKVAAILERRESLGQTAGNFIPRGGPRTVSFADPRAMEDEEDRERRLEEEKEDGRKILEREADGGEEENTTNTLKDMIDSMTPKKNPLKGRKSLHAGSARGLLGKRPAELDDDEDEAEEQDGVKRLKGHQGSPVKNVRLHAPPTKEETTGRLTRSAAKVLDGAKANAFTPSSRLSPQKGSQPASSPLRRGHFKDVDLGPPTLTVNFDEAPVMADPEAVGDDNGERIQLQDFLNMTSIRFMELTTTKRRHTQAPTSRLSASPSKSNLTLESCVVAGACTVPMLELYQHSCRELKKYISEGRRIVREIEVETLEENPPLFREYMSATPEFKTLMDNQFKNVKAHARLLSKAMWYEWRMKLQDGLKEGLVKISEGMDADEKLLGEEQHLVDSVLPSLEKKHALLETEQENLEAVARELADCDPEELKATRAELTDVDSDIKAKMQQIEELRRQLTETESSFNEASERKKECMADIQEAERVREECRGWTSTEIASLKAKTDKLEREHGWAITGIADTTVSMTYRREIELVFDTAAFQGTTTNKNTKKKKQKNADPSRIDLWYIAAHRERDAQPATPEREFFVQCIRDHVRGLLLASSSSTSSSSSSSRNPCSIRDMLDAVGAAWTRARHVARSVALLNTTFPTSVARTSDSAVAVRATLLLARLGTKVEIELGLEHRAPDDDDVGGGGKSGSGGGGKGGGKGGGGIEVAIVPRARVVYGEHFKTDRVEEYLATRIGTRVVAPEEVVQQQAQQGGAVGGGVESWSDVVVELQERLLARGRK